MTTMRIPSRFSTTVIVTLWALAVTPAAQAQSPAPAPGRGKKPAEEAIDTSKATAPKWDVAASLGPSTPLTFETTEGTWMNVDVSPDGKEIVFDLLGDIYVMPFEGTGGGLATRLTSGPAFDMQPRYSPDGRRIAFASDRDGNTNVWTMDRAGSDMRQASKDTRWFVNSPAWSRDGQYLFARRHFVKERSLGAGEIWMYHVSGADGIQVTEKTSWQKDAGEPAISPDAKTLYYSKDVTPGQSFEYNKNPYGIIYAIFARDLANGKERRLVSRPGGSIAPAPSPDGTRLAFIRRVDTKSVLFVRDRRGSRRPSSIASTRTCRRPGRCTGFTPSTDGRPTAGTSSSGAKAAPGRSTSRPGRGPRSRSARRSSRRCTCHCGFRRWCIPTAST